MVTLNQLKNIVIIILIFTHMDFIGHRILQSQYNLEIVPQNYYINKIIYGTLILTIAIFLWDRGYIRFSNTIYGKTFVLSTITVLALQLRYYNLYSSRFNIVVIILHYVILASLLYYFIEKQKI